MALKSENSIPVQIGQTLNLKVDSMSYDNAGVSRYNDFVVFVDRAAPNDKVSVEITSVKPNSARGKILNILESDKDYRIETPCKIFKVCGGCQWQYIPYEKQLEQKDLIIRNSFSKFNLDLNTVKPIIGAVDNFNFSPEDFSIPIWHYRNKVQYPVRTVPSTKRLKAGYFQWHSNDLINIKFCPIQHKFFDKVIDFVRESSEKYNFIAYDSKNKKGWLRHICVRYGFSTNEAILTLVVANEKFIKGEKFAFEIMQNFPELVGLCLNVNKGTTNVIYGPKTILVKGRDYIFEEVNDIKYKVSATSFFQVNTKQAKVLIDNVVNYAELKGNEVVLDAYCGGGFISLALAKYVKKVIGIEEIKQAIDDANFSAKENKIKNITFVFGKVENKISDIVSSEKIDLIVLDPPRSGCLKRVIEEVCKHEIKKVVYVSCNPSTLARDVNIFIQNGYLLKNIQPIDMFPHTFHIESVVLLEKT